MRSILRPVGFGLAMLLVLCVFPGLAEARTKGPAPLLLKTAGKRPLELRLRADRLRYAPCQRPEATGSSASPVKGPASRASSCRAKLELSGHVSITAQSLALHAPRIEVLLDRRGRPLALVAKHGVHLRSKGRSGSARVARLDARRRRLVLFGAAWLRCPDLGLSLRGKRIAIDLDSGRLAVDDARAELSLRKGRAAPGRSGVEHGKR